MLLPKKINPFLGWFSSWKWNISSCWSKTALGSELSHAGLWTPLQVCTLKEKSFSLVSLQRGCHAADSSIRCLMQELISFNNNNKRLFQRICRPKHSSASGHLCSQYFLVYLNMLKSYQNSQTTVRCSPETPLPASAEVYNFGNHQRELFLL